MDTKDAWSDPRTWATIVSSIIAAGSLFFAVLSSKWNRTESRLDALSKILQPLFRAAQQMHLANGCRRRCEVLKFSFPQQGDQAKEATLRINNLIEEYGDLLKEGSNEFRAAEAEFAARSFRFPDRISRMVDKAMKSLSEFGRLVNEGLFDEADLQFAKFSDDYSQISKEGRGWRLMDPFEGLKKRFRRAEPSKEKQSEFDLSESDMKALMELVHKRVTTQAMNGYAVHPPQKLLDRPEILKSDRIIEELQDSVFTVAFQDGTAKMMTLAELMVFTYNLVVLAHQMAELSQMMRAVPGEGTREIALKFQMSVDTIMRPQMVRALFDKIELSPVASDGAPVKRPA